MGSLNKRGLWLDLGPDWSRAIVSTPFEFKTLAGKRGLANSGSGSSLSTSLTAVWAPVRNDSGPVGATTDEESSKTVSDTLDASVDGGVKVGCGGCRGPLTINHVKCSLRLCFVMGMDHICLQRTEHSQGVRLRLEAPFYSESREQDRVQRRAEIAETRDRQDLAVDPFLPT